MAETSFIIENGRRLNLKDSSARKSIGSCDALQTETKHCLVDAINELNQKVGSGGGGSGSGTPGKDGEDGVSCTHSWNGTVLTVTSASGTSSADLEGPQGESGVYVGSGDMPDGYNVQIDPNGEGESLQDMINVAIQDAKAEIVNDVLEALPDGDEVSY